MKKERSSNIELLRIFAILLIIAFHYAFKGGFWFETVTVNKMIINVATMFGELGVNLFVLITGYFMINGTFRWKKVVYMMVQVQFYTWLSLFILNNGNLGEMLLYADRYDFCPNIYGLYWFTASYMLLYIVSPYLNRLIRNLSKKEHETLVVICLTLWCVIPTIFGMRIDDTETLLNYNRFIWMIVVYFIGAYISLYKDDIKLLSYKAGVYFVAAFLMLFMIAGIIFFMECHMGFFQRIGIMSATYFWRPNTIVMVIWSLTIFVAFLKLKMPNIKWINRLASTTLGIYMFHDGRLAGLIWRHWFTNAAYTDSKYLLVHMFVAVMAVFVMGAIIDLIRQFIGKYCDLLVQQVAKTLKKG